MQLHRKSMIKKSTKHDNQMAPQPRMNHKATKREKLKSNTQNVLTSKSKQSKI